MSEVINDMRAGILSTAQADSTLMTMISGRIFPAQLAEFTVETPPQDLDYPRVHFRVIGGPARTWTGRYYPLSLQVWSWSDKDYDEAWSDIKAFNDATTHERIAVGTAKFVIKVQNVGQEIFDPDATLYYISAQYRVHLIEG